jgi:hypothetical protein
MKYSFLTNEERKLKRLYEFLSKDERLLFASNSLAEIIKKADPWGEDDEYGEAVNEYGIPIPPPGPTDVPELGLAGDDDPQAIHKMMGEPHELSSEDHAALKALNNTGDGTEAGEEEAPKLPNWDVEWDSYAKSEGRDKLRELAESLIPDPIEWFTMRLDVQFPDLVGKALDVGLTRGGDKFSKFFFEHKIDERPGISYRPFLMSLEAKDYIDLKLYEKYPDSLEYFEKRINRTSLRDLVESGGYKLFPKKLAERLKQNRWISTWDVEKVDHAFIKDNKEHFKELLEWILKQENPDDPWDEGHQKINYSIIAAIGLHKAFPERIDDIYKKISKKQYLLQDYYLADPNAERANKLLGEAAWLRPDLILHNFEKFNNEKFFNYYDKAIKNMFVIANGLEGAHLDVEAGESWFDDDDFQDFGDFHYLLEKIIGKDFKANDQNFLKFYSKHKKSFDYSIKKIIKHRWGNGIATGSYHRTVEVHPSANIFLKFLFEHELDPLYRPEVEKALLIPVNALKKMYEDEKGIRKTRRYGYDEFQGFGLDNGFGAFKTHSEYLSKHYSEIYKIFLDIFSKTTPFLFLKRHLSDHPEYRRVVFDTMKGDKRLRHNLFDKENIESWSDDSGPFNLLDIATEIAIDDPKNFFELQLDEKFPNLSKDEGDPTDYMAVGAMDALAKYKGPDFEKDFNLGGPNAGKTYAEEAAEWLADNNLHTLRDVQLFLNKSNISPKRPMGSRAHVHFFDVIALAQLKNKETTPVEILLENKPLEFFSKIGPSDPEERDHYIELYKKYPHLIKKAVLNALRDNRQNFKPILEFYESASWESEALWSELQQDDIFIDAANKYLEQHGRQNGFKKGRWKAFPEIAKNHINKKINQIQKIDKPTAFKNDLTRFEKGLQDVAPIFIKGLVGDRGGWSSTGPIEHEDTALLRAAFPDEFKSFAKALLSSGFVSSNHISRFFNSEYEVGRILKDEHVPLYVAFEEEIKEAIEEKKASLDAAAFFTFVSNIHKNTSNGSIERDASNKIIYPHIHSAIDDFLEYEQAIKDEASWFDPRGGAGPGPWLTPEQLSKYSEIYIRKFPKSFSKHFIDYGKYEGLRDRSAAGAFIHDIFKKLGRSTLDNLGVKALRQTFIEQKTGPDIEEGFLGWPAGEHHARFLEKFIVFGLSEFGQTIHSEIEDILDSAVNLFISQDPERALVFWQTKMSNLYRYHRTSMPRSEQQQAGWDADFTNDAQYKILSKLYTKDKVNNAYEGLASSSSNPADILKVITNTQPGRGKVLPPYMDYANGNFLATALKALGPIDVLKYFSDTVEASKRFSKNLKDEEIPDNKYRIDLPQTLYEEAWKDHTYRGENEELDNIYNNAANSIGPEDLGGFFSQGFHKTLPDAARIVISNILQSPTKDSVQNILTEGPYPGRVTKFYENYLDLIIPKFRNDEFMYILLDLNMQIIIDSEMYKHMPTDLKTRFLIEVILRNARLYTNQNTRAEAGTEEYDKKIYLKIAKYINAVEEKGVLSSDEILEVKDNFAKDLLAKPHFLVKHLLVLYLFKEEVVIDILKKEAPKGSPKVAGFFLKLFEEKRSNNNLFKIPVNDPAFSEILRTFLNASDIEVRGEGGLSSLYVYAKSSSGPNEPLGYRRMISMEDFSQTFPSILSEFKKIWTMVPATYKTMREIKSKELAETLFKNLKNKIYPAGTSSGKGALKHQGDATRVGAGTQEVREVDLPSEIKVSESIYQTAQRPNGLANHMRYTISINNLMPTDIIYNIGKKLIHAGDGVAHTNVGVSGFTTAWALASLVSHKGKEALVIEQYQSDYPVFSSTIFNSSKNPDSNYEQIADEAGINSDEVKTQAMKIDDDLKKEHPDTYKDARKHFDYISKVYPYLVIAASMKFAKEISSDSEPFIFISRNAPYYADISNKEKAAKLYEEIPQLIPGTKTEGVAHIFPDGSFSKKEECWKIKASNENILIYENKARSLLGRGPEYNFALTPEQNRRIKTDDRKKKIDWKPDSDKIDALKRIIKEIKEKLPGVDVPSMHSPTDIIIFLNTKVRGKVVPNKPFKKDFGPIIKELAILKHSWILEERMVKLSRLLSCATRERFGKLTSLLWESNGRRVEEN